MPVGRARPWGTVLERGLFIVYLFILVFFWNHVNVLFKIKYPFPL